MIKYKITNKLINSYLATITNGDGVNILGKGIPIFFSESTKNNGYSDLIREIYTNEKENNVNEVIDNETIKFNSADLNGDRPNNSLKINFKFFSGGTYAENYLNAGFTQEELDNTRNNIKNSFYRVDFYDSADQKEQNFLFSEFLNVGTNTQTTEFPFTRLFFRKNDSKFIEENTFVDLYFEVIFFNAKTGLRTNFLNVNTTLPITLSQYNNNPSWRFAKLKVLNPYFTNPGIGNVNRLFYVEPINGNTDNLITFSQIVIQ